jgi:hypothetical protein
MSRTNERGLSAATGPPLRFIKIPTRCCQQLRHLETMPWSAGSAGPFSSQMRMYISSNNAILVNHTLGRWPSLKHKRLNIETVRRQLPCRDRIFSQSCCTPSYGMLLIVLYRMSSERWPPHLIIRLPSSDTDRTHAAANKAWSFSKQPFKTNALTMPSRSAFKHL